MSSHHIVRDEQEPALLIDDAQALYFEEIEQLLEWSPTVVVTERALEEVLKWNIKIDAVIARLNSLKYLQPLLVAQSPVQLLGFESSDLISCAFIYLHDHHYPVVNLLADIYQTNALDVVRDFRAQIEAVVFSSHQKWTYVPRGSFEKWVSIGHHFGIHPVAPNTFFRSQGFYGDWDNEMLLEPIELTSEIMGKISFKTNEKSLWLVESVTTDTYTS